MTIHDASPKTGAVAGFLVATSATIALQFALGHTLGFGLTALLPSPRWAIVVIASGNAVGVSGVGLAAARLIASPAPTTVRPIAGAIVGSVVGAALLLAWGRSFGYAAAAVPLTFSIVGFQAMQIFSRHSPQ